MDESIEAFLLGDSIISFEKNLYLARERKHYYYQQKKFYARLAT